MNTIVINTGTELLLGDVLNSHLCFIAREIFPLGLRVDRQLSVPDGPAIQAALEESFEQADFIFVTGGLGPTTDDITREITAELLGLKLHHDAAVLAAIATRAANRGFRLTDRTVAAGRRAGRRCRSSKRNRIRPRPVSRGENCFSQEIASVSAAGATA